MENGEWRAPAWAGLIGGIVALPLVVLRSSVVIRHKSGMHANHTSRPRATTPAAVPDGIALKPSAKTDAVSARPVPARSSRRRISSDCWVRMPRLVAKVFQKLRARLDCAQREILQ